MSTGALIVIALVLGLIAGYVQAVFGTLIRIELLIVRIKLDLHHLEELLERRG